MTTLLGFELNCLSDYVNCPKIILLVIYILIFVSREEAEIKEQQALVQKEMKIFKNLIDWLQQQQLKQSLEEDQQLHFIQVRTSLKLWPKFSLVILTIIYVCCVTIYTNLNFSQRPTTKEKAYKIRNIDDVEVISISDDDCDDVTLVQKELLKRVEPLVDQELFQILQNFCPLTEVFKI